MVAPANHCALLEPLGRAITAGVLAFSSCATFAQTPAQDGQWDVPFALPLISIHAAVLPTGKVLLFGAEHGVPGIHGWVLDSQSLALTDVDPPEEWNLDCAGHSFLADGRLLVAGGTLQFNPLLGSKKAYIFDSFAQTWIQVEDMAHGRWYPTNITLADGRVVTMSGVNDSNGALNQDIESWKLGSKTNWDLLGQRLMPDYPYLHLMPSGLVFRSGPDQQTETFNPATAQWTAVDGTIALARYEAPSVLLPPTLDRVMLIGGYNENTNGPPTASAEIIDFTDANPLWTATSPMAFARRDHNAVLLPDAKVLVIGGRSNSSGTANPIMIPEVFDPIAETWDQVAPHQIPRRYHSTAVLLPDGRVLAAGGDFQASGEIYSPAYLFQGPRPVIENVPATISYGQTFDLEFTSTTATNTVALVRLSSVTHSNNMDQRYVRLVEGVACGAPTAIAAPANGNIAPPGYYMLFIVNQAGVPSESAIVKVGPAIPCDVTADGVTNVDDLLAVINAWGPCPPPCIADVAPQGGNGIVNVDDLLVVINAWGPCT